MLKKLRTNSWTSLQLRLKITLQSMKKVKEPPNKIPQQTNKTPPKSISIQPANKDGLAKVIKLPNVP